MSESLSLPVQQRAWQTRERILVAAVECLAEEGYAATTTSRIQERAGVSRGSLLHQFPVRDDLLVAAVQHLGDERISSLHDSGPAGSLDQAVDRLWATYHSPLFSTAMEMWVAAGHNPDLAVAVARREHELAPRIRSSLAVGFGPEASAHPAFGEMITLLLTSMRGVAMTYAFEPRDPLQDANLVLWRRVARDMLGQTTR